MARRRSPASANAQSARQRGAKDVDPAPVSIQPPLRHSAAVHCHAAIQQVETAAISGLNDLTNSRTTGAESQSSTQRPELALDHVSEPRGVVRPTLIPSSPFGGQKMPPAFFASWGTPAPLAH